MAESEERPSKIRKLDSEIHSPHGGDLIKFNLTYGGVERERDNERGTPLNVAGSSEGTQSQIGQVLSKNQIKKLLKKERWEAGRQYRKEMRKDKHKKKKAEKAEQEASETAAADLTAPHPIPAQKNFRRPIQVPVTFVLDCSFDDLMTEKEIISLASQLSRCYSDNRSAPFKGHLVISSFGGQLRKRFETVLANHHHGWKGVKFMDGDFVQAAEEAEIAMQSRDGGRLMGALADHHELRKPPSYFKDLIPSKQGELNEDVKGEDAGRDGTLIQNSTMTFPVPSICTPSLVYLSSDSPNTLTSLCSNTTYIIGGLVDKNRHKGICYKRACERNIPTAKLPIGEYMTMQSRTVLATSHVIEIMVRWLEDGDWGKAFLRVIPKRKEARLKGKGVKSGDMMNDKGDESARQELGQGFAEDEITDDREGNAEQDFIEDEPQDDVVATHNG